MKEFFQRSHLLVHEHVDYWVVDSGSLSEESRGCCQPGVDVDSGTGRDCDGEGRIGCPADHKRCDHDDDHACHLPVRLSGMTQSPVGV